MHVQALGLTLTLGDFFCFILHWAASVIFAAAKKLFTLVTLRFTWNTGLQINLN